MFIHFFGIVSMKKKVKPRRTSLFIVTSCYACESSSVYSPVVTTKFLSCNSSIFLLRIKNKASGLNDDLWTHSNIRIKASVAALFFQH